MVMSDEIKVASGIKGWITWGVTASATLMFVVIVCQLVSPKIQFTGIATGNKPELATALLLDISLIMLVWRRSSELKFAYLARDAAKELADSLAWTDEVTGLRNRRFLTKKLTSLCSGGFEVALVMLDLDKFKSVNDLYGHGAGDALLKAVATRLEKFSPEGSCCARLGGDEFAIVLSGDHASADTVNELAGNILAELRKPISLTNTVVVIGASIGLCKSIPPFSEAETMLIHSDIAMYCAKSQGRNRFAWFDPEMEQAIKLKNKIEFEIRSSLAEGRFKPYFQPTIEASTGNIVGFEVLARWDHPERGIVEPDEFIAIAEAAGLISEVSTDVMRKALLVASAWPHKITISVNISPVQFKDPLLGQKILKVLTETGFPAGRLELEVTEGTLLEDRSLALATINSLKNLGIRIAIDDFGTGYASLSQLRQLPFDRIKIDKSFVAALLDDPQCHAIVHAIATLGTSLKLPITAEGVETQAIFDRLRELGCADMQGWLFSKAVPEAQAGQMLQTQLTELLQSSRSDARFELAAGHRLIA